MDTDWKFRKDHCQSKSSLMVLIKHWWQWSKSQLLPHQVTEKTSMRHLSPTIGFQTSWAIPKMLENKRKKIKIKKIKRSLVENFCWGAQGKQIGWKPPRGRLVAFKKERRKKHDNFYLQVSKEDDERTKQNNKGTCSTPMFIFPPLSFITPPFISLLSYHLL